MYYENNEVANDTCASTSPPARRAALYFEKLRDEFQGLLSSESLCREQIQKLENELKVYKRAFADLDVEKMQLETDKAEAKRQMGLLENQLKGHRVITLLDGDGTIFNSDLIARGQAGGHAAAQILSDSILQHLTSNYGAHQYQLWVYVFFNKRGLMEALGRFGNMMAKAKFEDFYMGFNQAAEKFLMVDVGSGKEAADAKIKAHLEDDIRLPQTYKIIFGGCHDNGYVTNLRSLITAGFKQKLILLRSYADLAAGIADLALPVLTIPDLFLTQKLGTPHIAPTVLGAPPGLGPLSSASPRVGPTQSAVPVAVPLVLSEVLEPPDAIPELMVEPDIFAPRRHSIPSSYSSALQSSRRTPTPDLDSSSSTASDTSDEVVDHAPAPTPRHINPKIALSKHKPPPCTLFYVTKHCKHGTECKYGHDYALEPEHIAEIRLHAKKAPCPATNKGDFCVWGDDCCYGHYCSLGPKCHFLKLGRCKFTGVDMHKPEEPKSQNVELP